MKGSVLFVMQKVNILIFGLNKLGMKNFVEFLRSEFIEVYRGSEVHHTFGKYGSKKDKKYYIGVSKFVAPIASKSKENI